MKNVIDLFLFLLPTYAMFLLFRQTESGPLLVSGVALYVSWLGTYISTIRKFLFSPKFRLDTDISRSPENTSATQISWFYRLKVSIKSNQAVDDCVGRMLGFYHSDLRNSTLDPLNLFWARQDAAKVDFEKLPLLGKGDFEYLDLAQYMNMNTHLALRVDRKNQMLARTGGHTFNPISDYFMKVGVFGKGGKSKIIWIRFQLLERGSHTSNPYGISILSFAQRIRIAWENKNLLILSPPF